MKVVNFACWSGLKYIYLLKEIQKIILDHFNQKNLTQSAAVFKEETQYLKKDTEDVETLISYTESGDIASFQELWANKFDYLKELYSDTENPAKFKGIIPTNNSF